MNVDIIPGRPSTIEETGAKMMNSLGREVEDGDMGATIRFISGAAEDTTSSERTDSDEESNAVIRSPRSNPRHHNPRDQNDGIHQGRTHQREHPTD